MLFSQRTRKLTLTAHVTASVGWMGAVGVFVVFAIIGLASGNAQLVRAVYLTMSPMAWYAILPLCLASLTTGLLQSYGTSWGFFRHYWVIFKLIINVLSTLILIVHMAPIDFISGVAANGPIMHGQYVPVRIQMLVASSIAFVALLVATVLSIYKPKGLTPYGLRLASK